MAELIRVRSRVRPHASVRVPNSLVPTLQIDSFAVAGTWARPALDAFWSPATRTANRVRVRLWAPGGGGNTNVGAGGGGAFCQADDVDASGASTFAVAGVANVGATVNGTDATFGATLVVAKGGASGGSGGGPGLASGCVGEIKFSGGQGQQGAGTMLAGGGAGSRAAAIAQAGGEAEGGLGSAGAGVLLGAGGGSTAAAGFAGARGACQVEYFVQALAGYARFLSYAPTRTAPGTAHSVVMPEGVAVGDLLVAAIGTDGNSVVTASAGWTPFVDNLEANLAIRGTAWWRVATGSDALTLTSGASTKATGACWRFAGAGTPEATVINGNGINANPPSHTRVAGGGAAVKGIWIAVILWDANAAMTIAAPPTGFGNWIVVGAYDGNGSRHSSAMLLSEVSTVDPGAFTAATEQWVAITMLIPPA